MKKITRGRFCAFAVLTSAALALTGCSSEAASSETGAVTDPNATISIGVKFMTSSWDPAKTTGSTELPILKLVYDGLLDVDAKLDLVPGLATSWESKDDGLTWELALREGVSFSNGDTFDAEDAKASLEHFRTKTSTIAADLGSVASIDVIDPHTLRITNKTPNVGTPAILSSRAGLMLSQEQLAAGDITSPIGTGEFLVESESSGVSLNLRPSPGAWQADVVHVAGVKIRAIEDPTAMANGLRSGELDLALIDPTQAAAVEGSGQQVYKTASQLVGMVLNPNLAPELKDPRVRNALNMAIDRQGIVSGILFGDGAPANQMLAEGMFGYNPDLAPAKYDLKEAKALLEKAGYAQGFHLAAVGQANNRQLLEAIQASWKEIGVDLELTFPPGTGVTQALFATPSVAAGTTNLIADRDPSYFMSRMLSPESPRNPGKVANPEVTGLLAKSATISDPEERAATLQKASALLAENTEAMIPIVWRYDTIAYGPQVLGMQHWQAGVPVLDGVGIAAK